MLVFGSKFALYSRMKKLLLLLFIPFISYSQEIGIKAGPSYTVSTGKLKDDYGKGKFFFNAGIYNRDDLGNAAFLLETKGRFAVQVGPTAVFNLKSKVTEIEAYRGSILPVNIDATAGVLFRASDRLGVNARYTYSIFESIEDTKYHPQSVQLSVNYMIKLF
jgi:hypothetical protein